MMAWIQGLDTVSIVFLCVALPATLILILQTVLSLIGIGDDGAGDDGDIGDAADDADVPDGVFGDDDAGDVPADTDPGFRLLTLRGLIAFFVTFGWMGLILKEGGAHPAVYYTVATLCGLAAMALVALLMMLARRLQSDGTLVLTNAVGLSGTVYLTIPAKGQGKGKVNVTVQGQYRELDAVTEEDEPLRTGTEIRVVGVRGGNTLVVTR